MVYISRTLWSWGPVCLHSHWTTSIRLESLFNDLKKGKTGDLGNLGKLLSQSALWGMPSRTYIICLVLEQLCCHVCLWECCFSVDTKMLSSGERKKLWGYKVDTTGVHPCPLLSCWELGRLYFSILLQLNRAIWLALANVTRSALVHRHASPAFRVLTTVIRVSSAYFRYKMEEHLSTWAETLLNPR